MTGVHADVEEDPAQGLRVAVPPRVGRRGRRGVAATRNRHCVELHLADAQKLLGKEGLINAMLALECNCADIDRAGTVRAEIQAILPDTQVIETEKIALAREEGDQVDAISGTVRDVVYVGESYRYHIELDTGDGLVVKQMNADTRAGHGAGGRVTLTFHPTDAVVFPDAPQGESR